MKKIPLLIALIVLLSACGGGGNPNGTPYVPSNNSNNTANFWQKIPVKYKIDGINVTFSGQYIYVSSMYRKTMRTNGTEYKIFINTHDDLAYVQYVDRKGRLHLTGQTYTDNGFDFIKNPNYKGVSGDCADNENIIICNNHANKVVRLTHGATLQTADIHYPANPYNQRFKPSYIGAPFTEFGTNGFNTFLIPEKDAGILISLDTGLTWKLILKEKGVFNAVAGNTNHPSRLFAGRPGGLYTTTDSGANWHKITAPIYKTKRVVRWVDIELLDDGTLIALTEMEEEVNNEQYFYKSTDFGVTWFLLNKDKSFFKNIEANSNFYFISSTAGNLHIAPR